MFHLLKKLHPALFTLLLVAILGVFSFGMNLPLSNAQLLAYGITDSSNPYLPSKDMKFEQAVNEYHRRINAIFANAINNLLTNPEAIAVYDVECGDNNISTYCVGDAALKELENYKRALIEHAKLLDVDENIRETQLSVSTRFASKINKVEKEIGRAEESLDLALAVYNELQVAYPIHLELMVTIDNLEDYKKRLKALRKQVNKFPSKFIDVTTNKCT